MKFGDDRDRIVGRTFDGGRSGDGGRDRSGRRGDGGRDGCGSGGRDGCGGGRGERVERVGAGVGGDIGSEPVFLSLDYLLIYVED